MWNFKGTLWNSTQNILPIHWKIWFLYNIEILRALRFKSSYAFLKRPPDPYGSYVVASVSSPLSYLCIDGDRSIVLHGIVRYIRDYSLYEKVRGCQGRAVLPPIIHTQRGWYPAICITSGTVLPVPPHHKLHGNAAYRVCHVQSNMSKKYFIVYIPWTFHEQYVQYKFGKIKLKIPKIISFHIVFFNVV